MKNIVSILLVLTMLAILLGGCGAPPTQTAATQPAATKAPAAQSAATKAPDAQPTAAQTEPSVQTVAYDGPDKDLVTAKGVYPIAKSVTPLEIAMVQNAKVEDYDTNMYTKLLEDTCGIDLVFNFLPSAQTSEKVQLLVASNDLPDILSGANIIDDVTMTSYGDEGLLLDLTPY